MIAEAGGRCEERKADGRRCWDRATDCDHIVNAAAGGTDDRSNLRALCQWHHRRKSAMEGVAARAAADAVLKRPAEKSPGLIDPAQPLTPPQNKGF